MNSAAGRGPAFARRPSRAHAAHRRPRRRSPDLGVRCGPSIAGCSCTRRPVGLLGRERVAALEDDDLADRAGEREGLLQGGIAAADHADLAVAQERRVAARAVPDAAAVEPLLAGRHPGPAAASRSRGSRPARAPRRRALCTRQPRPRARVPRLGHPDLGAAPRRPFLGHRAQLLAGRPPRGTPACPRSARSRATDRRARGRRPGGSNGPCGPSGPLLSGRRCRHRRWLRRSCQPPHVPRITWISGFRTSRCRWRTSPARPG